MNTDILVLYKHECGMRKDAELLGPFAKQKQFFFVHIRYHGSRRL